MGFLSVVFGGLGFLLMAPSALSDSDNTRFYRDKQVWALSLDNDLFAPGSGDRDFTGGAALTYSGGQGVKHWRALDSSLAGIDQLFTVSDHNGYVTPSLEIGTYGFTPGDIENPDIQEDDRPYSNLVYLSASRVYQSGVPGGDAWSSSLTIGVLGWDIFSDGQNSIHKAFDGEKAQGWDQQISDGGELTLRYQLAFHDYWQSAVDQHVKTTYFASVGYLTEVGVALSTRSGLISSPDYRFNPELISYGERVNESAATPYRGEEHYFWSGVSVKARAYNAFLQGQFKESEHTFDRDQLNPFIVEGWLGYTSSISSHAKFSYILRAQSSELREGEGDRGHVWGGFVFSRTI